jgi:prophage antirepressor-like protein
MPEVIPFQFKSHEVRALTIEGEPWFVAKDVCQVLEIEWKGSDSIGPLDEDERGRCIVPTPSGEQQMLTISESGLYALIFKSRKPEACYA